MSIESKMFVSLEENDRAGREKDIVELEPVGGKRKTRKSTNKKKNKKTRSKKQTGGQYTKDMKLLLAGAKQGNIDKIKTAVKNGVDVNTKPLGETALMSATSNGHKEIVSYLLEHPDINVNVKDSFDDSTALFYAIFSGTSDVRLDIMEMLIEKGADVNAKNKYGDTPLMYASKVEGRLPSVSLLLKHGANMNVKNYDDKTALMLARENGNTQVEELLESPDIKQHLADIETATRRNSQLLEASYNGQVDLVRALLEEGADINKTTNGRTPLVEASDNDHLEVVRILLERGADINKTDAAGNTPLYVASEAGNEEVVKILLENGAETNKANNLKQTPLMIAVGYGNLEIVEALLEYGANLNGVVNDDGVVTDGPPWIRSEMANLFKKHQQKNVATKIIEKTVERQKDRKNFEEIMEKFDDLPSEYKHESMQYLGGRRKTRKSKKSKAKKPSQKRTTRKNKKNKK